MLIMKTLPVRIGYSKFCGFNNLILVDFGKYLLVAKISFS